MAGIPAVALLLAISMIERRAGHTPEPMPEPIPDTTHVAEPFVTALPATDGHTPTVAATPPPDDLPRGPATPNGGPQATMRAHWDAEVAAGRIPTGAALNRAAGKDRNYSLGKRYAAAWRAELDGEPPR